jgi:hypothetical protein
MASFNLSETRVRWGAQDRLNVPAASLPYMAGLVSEALTMTPGQIPNPELTTGSQAATPIRGSVTVGGTLSITMRPSDAQTLLEQIQAKADVTPLTPATDPAGPTGSYYLELSPNQGTDQRVPLTFEIWRDDLNGAQLVYDCFVASAVFTWAEQSLVTAVLTLAGSRAGYWGDAQALGRTDDVPELYATGYPAAERRERRRPGTTGDMTLELVAETSPGIWDARACLGRVELLDIVDTTVATPTLTSASAPGTVDFRELLFPGDWVSVQEEGLAYEVLSVTESTVTLTTNFSATLAGKRLMRVFGEPVSGASVTFPVRSGTSAEGRPLFDEVLGAHDGLIFGDNVLRTLVTTGGTEIPSGSDTLALTGTVTVVASSVIWTGTATSFTTEVAVGMTLYDGANYYTVTSVNNDTELAVQTPHPAGLTGASVSIRRQFLAVRDRPDFALVTADEGPLPEIFARFFAGPTGETVEVELESFTLNMTLPRPAQTRVGSPWPGTVTESGVRAIVASGSVVYDERSQDLHNSLELSNKVALLVETRNGQPVVDPVVPGEEDVAHVETKMVLVAENLQNVSASRQVTAGAGRNLFPFNASLHPDVATGAPDLKIGLITDSDALLVAP